MKDFAKSIVCNTKTVAEKVGNFEDPKDAKRYIQMWERRKQDAKSWIDDANRKLRELHKDHGGAFGSLSESEKRSHKAEAQRHEDTIRKYQAEFEKYDNLIKQAQKSTWGNTRTGNSYNWEERRGHQELYDPTFPFGGHVRGYVEKTKNGYVGAKTNGSIVIKQKEFATEAEAKKFVENKQTGNTKVGNANTHLTASNSGELWLNFDGTGEMYDPIELGRYDFSGKSEALSVARELEQLKRKAEQKVKDADKFINAIKQWAAGLK